MLNRQSVVSAILLTLLGAITAHAQSANPSGPPPAYGAPPFVVAQKPNRSSTQLRPGFVGQAEHDDEHEHESPNFGYWVKSAI
jgi:hypothetical protein